MKFNEFVEKCKKMHLDFNGAGQLDKWYYPKYNRYGKNTKIEEPRLYVEWETGGVSGGSCWESSDPQSYSSNIKFLIMSKLLKSMSL